MKNFEQSTKVEFYLGSGGVGKSTISAVSAVKEAMAGKKVLIATFDPSLRLKDILIKSNGYQNSLLKSNLTVKILDPKKIFEDLLGQVDAEVSKSVKKNKLFTNLIERIQGVQEFSSLYFLNENLKSSHYDLIIIDTPPLQNSLDFFSSPQKLKDLFESPIVKLFIGDFNKNWLEKIFKKTRDIAFLTLKKLTGLDFFDQLISLMKALEKLQPTILETLNQSQIVLESNSTKYKFITSYETDRLELAQNQIKFMKEQNITTNCLIVNKYEDFSMADLDESAEWCHSRQLNKLSNHLEFLKQRFKNRIIKMDEIKKTLNTKIVFFHNFKNNILSEEDLIQLSKDLNESK